MMTTPRHYEITFETRGRATFVKRGRAAVGRVVLKESTGHPHYYTNRRTDHVFLNAMPNVIIALRERGAAWGMDVGVLRRLKKLGVTHTHILWKRGQTRVREYTCRIDKWEEQGTPRDFGHSPQLFLPFDRFIVRDAKTRARLTPWS